MHYISREARVGIVAVLGIFCLAFLAVFLRALKITERGDIYYLVFEDAGRVLPGTDVMLAGVRVGEVRDVILNPSTNLAQVEVMVESQFRVYDTYAFQISKGTLIGQTTIEIRPKTRGAPQGNVIPANNMQRPILGTSLPTVESVIPEINETLQTIQETTLSMKEILTDPTVVSSYRQTAVDIRETAQYLRQTFTDPAMARQINQTLSNVATTSAKAVHTAEALAKLADNVNSVIGKSRKEVEGTFTRLESAAGNVEAMTAKLNDTVQDPKISKNIDDALRTFQATLTNLQDSSEAMKKLAADPKLNEDLRQLLVEARTTTANLSATTERLRELASDTDLTSDVKATVREGRETATTMKEAMGNLKSASVELNETMKSARSAVDKVQRVFDRSTGKSDGKSGEKPNRTTVRSDLTLRHLGGANRTLSDLTLRAGSSRSYYSTGLYGIGGDGVQYTLQKGLGLSDRMSGRAGLYRSQFGIGLDQQFGTVRTSLDLYDPNRPRYAGWLGLRLTPKMDAVVGYERDRNRRNLVGAGARIRLF